MLEKDIEKYLRDQVKILGGKAYKFVSPGNAGVPDRMICLPGGQVMFVELKAPGKKQTPLQLAQMRRLLDLGFWVMLADSKAAVDYVISKCRQVMSK